MYQFWSAYPDSLFAGLVLLAFNLTDHIAVNPQRDTRWQILGLGVTIYVAIHTKLFGAILMLACPLYLLMHARELITRSSQLRAKLAILCVVFVALTADLGAAALHMNPLLDFADGAGFGGYKSGLVDGASRDIEGSLAMLGFAVLLVFQVTLPFLATPAATPRLEAGSGRVCRDLRARLAPVSRHVLQHALFSAGVPFPGGTCRGGSNVTYARAQKGCFSGIRRAGGGPGVDL